MAKETHIERSHIYLNFSVYEIKELESIKIYYNFISIIIEEAGGGIKGFYNAMEEPVRDKPSILKHIETNQQKLKGLCKSNINFYDYFSDSEIKEYTDIRNTIAHGYEGLDYVAVEAFVFETLPRLIEKIDTIIQDYQQNNENHGPGMG